MYFPHSLGIQKSHEGIYAKMVCSWRICDARKHSSMEVPTNTEEMVVQALLRLTESVQETENADKGLSRKRSLGGTKGYCALCNENVFPFLVHLRKEHLYCCSFFKDKETLEEHFYTRHKTGHYRIEREAWYADVQQKCVEK